MARSRGNRPSTDTRRSFQDALSQLFYSSPVNSWQSSDPTLQQLAADNQARDDDYVDYYNSFVNLFESLDRNLGRLAQPVPKLVTNDIKFYKQSIATGTVRSSEGRNWRVYFDARVGDSG